MTIMRQARIVAAGLLAAFLILPAQAKDAKPDGYPGQVEPAVSSEPQQTSASFGDWVVRCVRAAASQGAGKPVCEVAQSLLVKGQQDPIAQIAFGRPPAEQGADPGLTLTVLLPVSIAFDKPPKLGPGPDDAQAVTLTFRRCLPGGCLADVKADAALLTTLRTASKPGHLSFTDAAERTLTLPLSGRGLAQALDQLAKETSKEASR